MFLRFSADLSFTSSQTISNEAHFTLNFLKLVMPTIENKDPQVITKSQKRIHHIEVTGLVSRETFL